MTVLPAYSFAVPFVYILVVIICTTLLNGRKMSRDMLSFVLTYLDHVTCDIYLFFKNSTKFVVTEGLKTVLKINIYYDRYSCLCFSINVTHANRLVFMENRNLEAIRTIKAISRVKLNSDIRLCVQSFAILQLYAYSYLDTI